MRSARSFSFFRPAKTILVPGMYLAGFSRYRKRCSEPQRMPDPLLAAVYAKPSTEPEWRPTMPWRLGPCAKQQTLMCDEQ
jgi:hypothetical protein